MGVWSVPGLGFSITRPGSGAFIVIIELQELATAMDFKIPLPASLGLRNPDGVVTPWLLHFLLFPFVIASLLKAFALLAQQVCAIACFPSTWPEDVDSFPTHSAGVLTSFWTGRTVSSSRPSLFFSAFFWLPGIVKSVLSTFGFTPPPHALTVPVPAFGLHCFVLLCQLNCSNIIVLYAIPCFSVLRHFHRCA
eukprot:RCo027004